MKHEKRTSIIALLQDIAESAKRILALDGKDADVCEAVQDILVAAKSIEWTITEE